MQKLNIKFIHPSSFTLGWTIHPVKKHWLNLYITQHRQKAVEPGVPNLWYAYY